MAVFLGGGTQDAELLDSYRFVRDEPHQQAVTGLHWRCNARASATDAGVHAVSARAPGAPALGSAGSPAKLSGGMRAMSPRFNGPGRLRHGIRPSVDSANR